MERPRPKELVVTVLGVELPILQIATSTEDARTWAEREAQAFGQVFHGNDQGDCVSLILHVAPVYDFNEVVAFLRSYTA